MSHFSNDAIVDSAIIDAVDAVQNMSDRDVKKQLFNLGKKVLPSDIADKRDILVDVIAQQKIDLAMDMGGPHG